MSMNGLQSIEIKFDSLQLNSIQLQPPHNRIHKKEDHSVFHCTHCPDFVLIVLVLLVRRYSSTTHTTQREHKGIQEEGEKVKKSQRRKVKVEI